MEQNLGKISLNTQTMVTLLTPLFTLRVFLTLSKGEKLKSPQLFLVEKRRTKSAN